jgi:hypothetical protein
METTVIARLSTTVGSTSRAGTEATAETMATATVRTPGTLSAEITLTKVQHS